MDITFYVLITLASIVLLLAMWACAAHGVPQWGPDLTLELPPHLLRDVFFEKSTTAKLSETFPSKASDLAGAPLLTHAQPLSRSAPPPPPPPRPPKPSRSVLLNNTQVVRVLPSEYVQQHKLRPTHCFVEEKPS